MRRRIAVYGVTEEVLHLLPALARHPDLELVAVVDPDARVHRRRLALLEPACAALLQRLLTDDGSAIESDPALDAVIDGGIEPPLRGRLDALAGPVPELLTPAAARARYGLPLEAAPPEPLVPAREEAPGRAELLEALGEISASAELFDDSEALFGRLLESALAVTGATRGSLLEFRAADDVLAVRSAVGLERGLWPAARQRLGDGIAGRAAAEGRPLVVSGRADPSAFRLARERLDAASALVIPLLEDDALVGVLCLHHPTREDLFGDADLRFGSALGAVAARLVARALRCEAGRRRAAADAAARETRRRLATREPLPARLAALCQLAAEEAGGGAAALWLSEPSAPELRLAASSLSGGGLGGELRLAPGEGVDGRAAADGAAIVLEHAGRLAYAALPLAGRARPLGLLAVQAGPTPHGDSETALRAVADAAGRELERLDRETRAGERAARAEALHETALRLLALRDPDEIARLAAGAAALGLGAEHALVRLRLGSRFALRASTEGAREPLCGELLALDRAAAREALRRRALVGTRDVPAAEGRALLAAPLRAGALANGTLVVVGRRGADPRDFDAEERAWFARLADYAAIALAHARSAEPPRAAGAGALAQQLAAALALGEGFALLSCWLEEGAQAASPDALLQLREGLRAHLGASDLAFDAEHGAFALLAIRDADGPERVARLARAVAEHVSKLAALRDAPRPALAFGYALRPEEGDEAGALLARASTPRIRML